MNSIRHFLVIWLAAICCCGLWSVVNSQGKPRTCNETSFCTRLRAYQPDMSPYKFLMDSINVVDSQALVGKMVNADTEDVYLFSVHFYEHSTIRLQIGEETVYRPRFHPKISLAGEPSPEKFKLIDKTQEEIIIETATVLFKLSAAPATLELYHSYDKNLPALVINDMGRLVMEYNQKEKGSEKYREVFDGSVDTRPYGPMAVGLDFSFPKANNLYGLPMHLETLTLQSTKNGDPYRLFNVDFGDQKSHDRRSMYGSVPFVIAHGVNTTAGIFWYNTADTWVDIDKADEQSSTGYNVYFMSETGSLDAFLFLGPTFYQVTQQYAIVTGKAPLPPFRYGVDVNKVSSVITFNYSNFFKMDRRRAQVADYDLEKGSLRQYFALGYHQSKWNYFTQKEVLEVADNFDKNNFPLDAIWLDIEYTDQKKYFTWDPANFSNPTEMINTLAAKNRKLVVIIDPHIKKDPEYKVYKDAIEKGLLVHYSNGSVFYGRCWPNESAWIDFINPEAREYWAQQYLLDNFKGTTEDVFIWNDMNEPSVFDGPENTFPKDLLHFNGWEHRDVHNVYGLLEVASTYDGLMRRSQGQKRPFILSRSYYTGIQRYSAIWLGDNFASFHSMRNSIAMCLTASLCGISFCGADVGGFNRHPDSELLIRWYQLGAFMPFYREHSTMGLPSREPYVQDEPVAKLIRQALQDRQILLPFWYTLFYAHSVKGKPVIRPLVLEFPDEVETFDIEYEYLIGDAMLVRPLTEAGLTGAEVYFPGGEGEIWYPYIPAFAAQTAGKRFIQLTAEYNSTLVFVRGGQIIAKCADAENKPLPSAKDVLNADISLYIAPSKDNKAAGFLYIDDGESFAYKNKSYSSFNFEYDANTLRTQFADDNKFPAKQSVAQLEVAGEKTIRKAYAKVDGVDVQLDVVSQPHVTYLVAKKGQLPLSKEWTVTFE